MKSSILVSTLLLASCTTTPIVNDWPSHTAEIAEVTLKNIQEKKEGQEYPAWFTQDKQKEYANCLAKSGAHLIEALCAPFDASQTTKVNLSLACNASMAVGFAFAELQAKCVQKVTPKVLEQ